MKERSIPFYSREVNAALEGRMSQFRRPIKPQPLWIGDPNVPFKTPDANPKGIIKCPYGKPGDRLWVRETWRKECCPDCVGGISVKVRYRADGEISAGKVAKWKSSIHMPREASRITLKIDEIKVERIQDISTDDIKVEGILQRFPKVNDQFTPDILKGQFIDLWSSINKKRGCGWKKNPWVWVVKFHQVEE